MILFIFLLFIVGAALGSFVGVLADRLPRGEKFINDRSRCDSCKKRLTPIDLIPVFSYLFLMGRCRQCKAKIPPHLFVIEIFSGITSVSLLFYILQNNYSPLAFILLLFIALCFIGIFVADFIYGIIPDEFVIGIVVLSFLFLFLISPGLMFINFLVGALSFLFFFAIYYFTHGRGMGFGDVKLAFAMGFFLGFPSIVIALYFAFLTAMCISLILIVTGRKKLKGGTIAFGPFLAAGAIFAFFLSDRIIGIFF